jgi:hypothetical protein
MTYHLSLLVVLAALSLPTVARGDLTAGTGTATITESKDPSESPKTINASECTGTDPDGNSVTDYVTVGWSFTSGFNSSDTVRIDVSDTSACPVSSTTVHTGNLVPAATITNPSATDQWPRSGDTTNRINAGALVTALASAGASVSCSTSSTTIYVCVVDVTQSTVLTTSINLTTTAPSAPTIASVDPGNQGLYVSWSAVSGTSITYMIRATAVDASQDGTTHDSGSISGTTGRIGGLTNGVTYSVVVFALSSVGNRSAASSAVNGTPVQTDDFWDRYHQAGGVEEGGCGGPTGLLSPLLLLVALWLRRRP